MNRVRMNRPARVTAAAPEASKPATVCGISLRLSGQWRCSTRLSRLLQAAAQSAISNLARVSENEPDTAGCRRAPAALVRLCRIGRGDLQPPRLQEHGASYQQIWTWNPANSVLKALTHPASQISDSNVHSPVMRCWGVHNSQITHKNARPGFIRLALCII